MLATSRLQMRCFLEILFVLIAVSFVCSAEVEKRDGLDIPAADSPAASGAGRQPPVVHMSGRFYRGPMARTRPDSSIPSNYWQRRQQMNVQTSNHGKPAQTHSQQKIEGYEQRSGQLYGQSGSTASQPPQSLWRHRERFSQVREMGARRFSENHMQAVPVNILHSTPRPLFSWDDVVPVATTPTPQPTSNAHSRQIYGIPAVQQPSSRTRFPAQQIDQRPIHNTEDNVIPKLNPAAYHHHRPHIESPMIVTTQPANQRTNQESNELHPYQTGVGHTSRHGNHNTYNRIRPHHPYWLGSDNQTRAAAQEYERRRIIQESSGLSSRTFSNGWRTWNQRTPEEIRRRNGARRFGQGGNSESINRVEYNRPQTRPTSIPNALPPSTTPGVQIIRPPWTERRYIPSAPRPQTAVNRGWFKVTNPTADIVFKLKPPTTSDPLRGSVVSSSSSQSSRPDISSYGYTVVSPSNGGNTVAHETGTSYVNSHHQQYHHNPQFPTSRNYHHVTEVPPTVITPFMVTTEVPPFQHSNIYHQENVNLGINGMESRNQRTEHTISRSHNEILTPQETAYRHVYPKVVKPSYPSYNNVLKHTTEDYRPATTETRNHHANSVTTIKGDTFGVLSRNPEVEDNTIRTGGRTTHSQFDIVKSTSHYNHHHTVHNPSSENTDTVTEIRVHSKARGSVSGKADFPDEDEKRRTLSTSLPLPPGHSRESVVTSTATPVFNTFEEKKAGKESMTKSEVAEDDVTCLHKNFQPAPAVDNAVIKYVRVSTNDGDVGGYIEAEYICNPGFQLVAEEQPARLLCKGKQWVGKVPRCQLQPPERRCSLNNAGCQQKCTEDSGRPVCSCQPGYMLVSETQCDDINECSVNNGRGPCQDGCENTPGSYRCKCDRLQGTVLAEDGQSCRREDECPPTHGCSHQCINTRGGPFCLCPNGLVLGADWKTCQGSPPDVKKDVQTQTSEELESEENTFILSPKEDSEESEEDDVESTKASPAYKTNTTEATENEVEEETKRQEEEVKRKLEEEKQLKQRKLEEEAEKKRTESERRRIEEELAQKENERKQKEEELKRKEEERKREEEERKREGEERKREEEERKREEEERKREKEERKREEEERKREKQERTREEQEMERRREQEEEEGKRSEVKGNEIEEHIKKVSEDYEEEKRMVEGNLRGESSQEKDKLEGGKEKEEESMNRKSDEESQEEEDRKREEEERRRQEEDETRRREEEERKLEEDERKLEEQKKREEEDRNQEEEESKRQEKERKQEEIKREEEERKQEEEERKQQEEEREQEERKQEEEEKMRAEEERKRDEEEKKREEEKRQREEEERKRDEEEKKREEEEKKREEEERKREEEERKREEEERKREEEERKREEEEGKREEEEQRREEEERRREEEQRKREEEQRRSGSQDEDREYGASEDREEQDNSDVGGEEEERESEEIRQERKEISVEKSSREENGERSTELEVGKEGGETGGSRNEVEDDKSVETSPRVEKSEESKGDPVIVKDDNADENEDDGDENENDGDENENEEEPDSAETDGNAIGKESNVKDEDPKSIEKSQRENGVGRDEEQQKILSTERKTTSHENEGRRESGEEEAENAEEILRGSEDDKRTTSSSTINENGGIEDAQEATRKENEAEARSEDSKLSESQKSLKSDRTENEEYDEDGDDEDESKEQNNTVERQTEDERREKERQEEQRIRQNEEEEKRRMREREEERQRLDEERRRQREEEEEEERRREREEEDEEEEEREDEEEGDEEENEGEDKEGEDEDAGEDDDGNAGGVDRDYIDDQPHVQENVSGDEEVWIACPGDVTAELPEENSKVAVQIPRPKASKNIEWKRDVESVPTWGRRLRTKLPAGDFNVRFIATEPRTGRRVSCSVLVSVKAPEAPVATKCPGNLHIYAAKGARSVKASWEEPFFVDNVGIVRFHRSKAPGSRFPIGVSTVTYSATDAAGHVSQCAFEVHVHRA